MTADGEKTLCADEVAALLRMHVATVWRLIERGELLATKEGRSWRIPEISVVAFLRRRSC